MADPATTDLVDPMEIQRLQLQAQRAILASLAHLPLMSSKLDEVIAENKRLNDKIEAQNQLITQLANRAVKHVCFFAVFSFPFQADVRDTESIQSGVMKKLNDQLDAWKAANAGKRVVRVTPHIDARLLAAQAAVGTKPTDFVRDGCASLVVEYEE